MRKPQSQDNDGAPRQKNPGHAWRVARPDRLLAAKRLRLLIEQLGDERGRDTGWKTEVGSKLGIGSSVLSKLNDPSRSVSSATVQKVVDALGIDAQFFYDRSLGEAPRYRDFIDPAKNRTEARAPASETLDPPHWKDFLRLYDRIALLTPDDLARIQRYWSPGHEVTSWRDWAQLANWLLDRRTAN